MSPLDYALKRLNAFIDEAERLKELEFPYPHSHEALKALAALFESGKKWLELIDPGDTDVVINECALALELLFEYLPLLGFVLRSTNVRNAFESYGPLLRLSHAVLEPKVLRRRRKTQLLLSSEWDYSPFTYTGIRDMPSFVLIGMPAPESSNPLLLPLAGHELGHSLWPKSVSLLDRIDQYQKTILSIIEQNWDDYLDAFPQLGKITFDKLDTSLFKFETFDKAVSWILRQAEESFCDFVGLRIFGTSYLHAFAYLVSPTFSSPRPVNYPNLTTRTGNLLLAAKKYHISVPTQYASLFRAMKDPDLPRGDAFQLFLADQTLGIHIESIMVEASNAIKLAGVPLPQRTTATKIYERFKRVVPAEGARSLADIINAAWVAYEDPKLWESFPRIRENRDRVLRELVLKNIEVYEIEQILRDKRRRRPRK